MSAATYSRPLGIAELVRQHGDNWLSYGLDYACRIHDDRLRRAYVRLMKPNSSDFSDYVKMSFYTRRIHSCPINEVRGKA